MTSDGRAMLLGFDPDEGRLIIARNNPDDARYVVVVIPGAGSGMHNADPLFDLVDTLISRFEGDDFSVVGWADYVAPQDSWQARDPAYAAAATGRLASFLAGLPVTAENFGRYKKAARVVVVGLGYGGLVAGLTGREHGLAADALVLLGCAGAGVDSAAAARVRGPVYVTPDDPGDGTPPDAHGIRPDTPAFGATLLRPGPLTFRRDPFVRYLPSLRRIVLGTA
ncbi:alpha/beta hydrolase [Amycolatopsis eburnea]|uniref:DUF1023 domain-containing protein n=1 Tax=Amycolatopsis eburnea TaxID=2267691 RepID=A0A427SWV1_9PSEU|nr:alpha/beta hydrolase [Amycolatopsis eburnea]RSD09158.1 hypothetical protein EIY87_39510 [Amycolatopsis eburnea]